MHNSLPSYEEIKDEANHVYEGERYPPIPLPAPPTQTVTKPQNNIENFINTDRDDMNHLVLLESGLAANLIQVDGLEAKNIVFNDQTIRKGFIRKVYSILLVQLLITCGVISIFTYHEPTKNFVQENRAVLFLALVINIVVMLSMVCCETARRSYPINFVLLGLYTMTMSLLLGAIASNVDSDIVLMAVGITALLVVTLSIYAIQTKYDFTACGGVLLSLVICLLFLSISAIFVDKLFGNIAISCFGALVASLLLIYDTQSIIGGNHKYQFNPEDYIFAALTLYVDITRIFLYVLRFLKR